MASRSIKVSGSVKSPSHVPSGSSEKIGYLPWVYWGCGVLFYVYQFILRVSPGIMIKDLMGHFLIDASTVSILAAFYYKSYSTLQIPMGIMIDRMGPRRLLSLCGLLCAGGGFLFANASSLGIAFLGRLLIGAGSVGGFIGCARIIRDFFPPERFGFMISLTMTLGTLGALSGGMPLALLMESYGWQQSILFVSFLGLGITALIWLILRDIPSYHQKSAHPSAKAPLTAGLKQVITNRHVWIAAICAMGLYLPLSVFADLWGPSFIMEAFDVSRSKAAGAVSFVYIGLCVGSVSFAIWAEKIGSRRIPIMVGILGTCILLCVLLWGNTGSLAWASVLMFCLGLCTGAETLGFAMAADYIPAQFNGVTIGFVNTVVMIFGALLQPLVGGLLDYLRAGKMVGGLPYYALSDFRIALSVVVACALVTLGTSLFLKEKA